MYVMPHTVAQFSQPSMIESMSELLVHTELSHLIEVPRMKTESQM